MPASAPVPKSLRLGIGLLAAVLALLLGWLLSFFLDDIGDISGPDWGAYESRHVDAALEKRHDVVTDEIAGLERRAKRQTEIQKELSESMNNARGTMEQMMEFQRLALQQNAPPNEAEKEALAAAQQRFLDAQEEFETANTEIAAGSEKRFELEREQAELDRSLKAQRAPAEKEYQEARQRHHFRVAAIKLAVIVPLFLLAAWLLYRWRNSAYRALAIALLAATGWKLFAVMFDHFPRDFFKYIAIFAGIGTVIWFLVWLVRKATKPNADLVLSRNRESYEKHRCPVCSYPILRGPFKNARWTKRGPILDKAVAIGELEDSPYDCPSCGTNLFGECGGCQSVRHTLLPFCSGCGSEE